MTRGSGEMNFAISDKKFKYNYNYEDLNKFIFDKIMNSGKICNYYMAEIIYKNMELVEPFYIDLNNMKICWLNDWYEGGDIYCLFGFVDSITISDFTIKYLWKNRYRGDFEDDTTLYSKAKLTQREWRNENNKNLL